METAEAVVDRIDTTGARSRGDIETTPPREFGLHNDRDLSCKNEGNSKSFHFTGKVAVPKAFLELMERLEKDQ